MTIHSITATLFSFLHFLSDHRFYDILAFAAALSAGLVWLVRPLVDDAEVRRTLANGLADRLRGGCLQAQGARL